MNKRWLLCAVAGWLIACGNDDGVTPVMPLFSDPVLMIVSGDEQVGPAGLPLPVDVMVQVTDRAGLPLPGAEVIWRVTEGGGTLDVHRIFTDSAGRAAVEWTLGEDVGQQLLYASSPGAAGVTFRARSALFFAAVATGWRHTCGLDPRGLAWCWGDNFWGQLGDGTRVASSLSRMVVSGRSFDTVYAGMMHTCALDGGTAYCWGDNGSGQLGDGTTRTSTIPVRVTGVDDFVFLTLGYDHACGGTATGELYCWGNNTYGQIGSGTGGETCSLGGLNAPCTRLPRAVTLPGVTVAAATGEGHTCAVTGLQRTYCWGLNDWGQLGIGRFGGSEDEPAVVIGDVGMAEVFAWGRSTCALDAAGSPYCWGRNSRGNLGVNSVLNIDRPTPVVSTGKTIAHLTMADAHTCGQAADDSLYCWGEVLGNGSSAGSLAPVEVGGGRVYSAVSAGGGQTCGMADGVWCWGSNAFGQLGLSRDSVSSSTIPLLVRPAAPPAGGL